VCELKAQDVADYFLANVDEEGGDNITNLKLQKLLYYAQGFHVAMHGGETLFPEAVVAWNHGPVVRPVWSRYKHLGSSAIARPTSYQADAYAPEVSELLDAVYATYGQFTATRLRQMTHEESPWKLTRRSETIRVELLQDYFTKLVEAAKRGETTDGRPLWPVRSFRHQRRKSISASMAPHRQKIKAMIAMRRSRIEA
jgi:uncharacterized phage-associated protein